MKPRRRPGLLGKRFDLDNSALMTFAQESTFTRSTTGPVRAQEILNAEAEPAHQYQPPASPRHHQPRPAALSRNHFHHRLGQDGMGGVFHFQNSPGSRGYKLIGEDLLDRKTVLAFKGNAGWIWGSSPFFERFYAGGIGAVRASVSAASARVKGLTTIPSAAISRRPERSNSAIRSTAMRSAASFSAMSARLSRTSNWYNSDQHRYWRAAGSAHSRTGSHRHRFRRAHYQGQERRHAIHQLFPRIQPVTFAKAAHIRHAGL